MAGLTLGSLNCFQPRTPGLGIQHVNHQANACLDLSISFLYMSKRCSISVIYSQSNSSIFCTTIFRSPSYMKCHSSFRTIKQNKSEVVSQLFSASCFYDFFPFPYGHQCPCNQMSNYFENQDNCVFFQFFDLIFPHQVDGDKLCTFLFQKQNDAVFQ